MFIHFLFSTAYIRLIFLIPTSLKRERHIMRTLIWPLSIWSLSNSFWLSCMCMNVQVCMCGGGGVCMWGGGVQGQYQVSSSDTSHLIFWDMVSHWTWSVPVWLDGVADKPRDPPPPAAVPTRLGLQVLMASSFFYVYAGSVTEVIMLMWPLLCQLSHFPSPTVSLLTLTWEIFLLLPEIVVLKSWVFD